MSEYKNKTDLLKLHDDLKKVVENFNNLCDEENIKEEIEKNIGSKECVDFINSYLNYSQELLASIDELDGNSYLAAWAQIILMNSEISLWNCKWKDETEFKKYMFPITQAALSLQTNFVNLNEINKLKKYEENAKNIINSLNLQKDDLEKTINQNKILSDDLKNKKVNEIFEDDSEKFKILARRYEIAFYLALAFLFLYFFGWYIEIDIANFKFKIAEQFHGNYTTTFYVQKISLLILSTTLAAFLLKRSFMNRRLADDAYRTAKELDALPRYMEGMPDEMKEKIRFDLAYKYFGNGIHHDSYTGGENLMHENIKANTDFIKAVKDIPDTKTDNKD